MYGNDFFSRGGAYRSGTGVELCNPNTAAGTGNYYDRATTSSRRYAGPCGIECEPLTAAGQAKDWLPIKSCLPDTDGDDIPDPEDNCPNAANPLQENSDLDALGDVCDNCPKVTNAGQSDSDSDGAGDVCDNCPTVSNPGQVDSEGPFSIDSDFTVFYIDQASGAINLDSLAAKLTADGISYADNSNGYLPALVGGEVEVAAYPRYLEFTKSLGTTYLNHKVYVTPSSIVVAYSPDYTSPDSQDLFRDAHSFQNRVTTSTTRTGTLVRGSGAPTPTYILDQTIDYVYANGGGSTASSVFASTLIENDGYMLQGNTLDYGATRTTSWVEFTIPPDNTVKKAWLRGLAVTNRWSGAKSYFYFPDKYYYSGYYTGYMKVSKDVTAECQGKSSLKLMSNDAQTWNTGGGANVVIITEGTAQPTETHSFPDQGGHSGYDWADEAFIVALKPLVIGDGKGDACDCDAEGLCTAAAFCQGAGTPDADCCADNDGDGYFGTPAGCGSPNDCNDNNVNVYPGAAETCNNVDDNCDGTVDSISQACGSGACVGNQLCTAGVWGACSSQGTDVGVCAVCDATGTASYDDTQDTDCPATTCPADGCGAGSCGANLFGDFPDTVANECSALYTCTQNTCTATCGPDADSDQYSPQCGDCDDAVASCISDCTTLWYNDQDNDGFGDPNSAHRMCDAPAGYIADNTDNCPAVSNPGQEDFDGDGIGDVCDTDVDGDGVLNEADKCDWSTTAESVGSEGLRPDHYSLSDADWTFDTSTGESSYTMADTFGCTAAQILFCKPGANNGEDKFGMTSGTLNVWMSQTGWSQDCQVDGKVVTEGASKDLFENTDNSGLWDLLDSDNDNDGVVDSEDSEPESTPDAEGKPKGKPDWWCEKNPNKC
jgi:hypothetical protein